MSRTSRRPRYLGAAAGLAAVGLAAATLAPAAQSAPGSPSSPATGARAPKAGGVLVKPNLDVRDVGGRAPGAAAQQKSLLKPLGPTASVEVDPLTGTLDEVVDPSGFLTAASSADPAAVALDYVRGHLDALGLRSADLSTLVKSRQYTDINDITHVFWQQRVDGVTLFGNGLQAHVAPDGQLLSVQGAPVSGLAGMAGKAPTGGLDKAAAIDAAAADGGGTARPGASAERTWFYGPSGLRPAWSTVVRTGPVAAYQHVIDAVTGEVLYRHSLVSFDHDPVGPGEAGTTGTPPADRPGQAYVFDNYPGATDGQSGGAEHLVDLIGLGYLDPAAAFPKGQWARVWIDANDDDRIQKREKTEVPQSLADTEAWRFHAFKTAKGQEPCTEAYLCTWNPKKGFSWQKNQNQDGLQGLYYTSAYAEWLDGAPFGFDEESGNFTAADGDAVDVNTMDGATTGKPGLPDGFHVNNANFFTPPDGQKPRMQMYLNWAPYYMQASSTYAFDNIGHEYTHGLSNRLVVDSDGNSTLGSYQSSAMGEAWGDFYSFDYLDAHGFLNDDDPDVPGELMYDRYLSHNRPYTRSQAIDCKPGIDTKTKFCRYDKDAGEFHGYTFGDVGRGRALGTEVHSAGEVWAQTMWDVHEALGHEVTMGLVTEGMRLAKKNPGMLDMRDAMFAADQAMYSGAHYDQMWELFAARGFGFEAESKNGNDPKPKEDFTTPPPL